MADNGITHSYEAMRLELESAGYRFDSFNDGLFVILQVFAPDRNWQLRKALDGFEDDEKPNRLVDEAFAHLQTKRRAAELAAFVQEIAQRERPWLEDGDLIEDAVKWIERAQKLVGKE